MKGRGTDFNDALGNLPHFVASAADVLDVLDAQSAAVRRLVRNTGVTFGAINQNQRQLHNLIVNTEDTFGALASQNEALASGNAISRRYGVSPEHLNDPNAWAEIGRWIGLATVNVTAVHDPEVVVFGGGVCSSWQRFAPALFETVQRHLHLQQRPEIVLGTLGEKRSLLGALLIAEDGPRAAAVRLPAL